MSGTISTSAIGVTITGPHTVARMTNAIDVQRGDKVLEIGTGSGYQSAYLSNLTDQVYSIEIIKPLFERTGGVYADLIGGATRNTRRSTAATPMAITAGKRPPRSTRSSSPAASTTSRRRCCSS